MQMTQMERLNLVNQYLILAALYPDDKEHYLSLSEIVRRGYEFFYDDLTEGIYEDEHSVSVEEAKDVLDILTMYENMYFALQVQKVDLTPAQQQAMVFPGFDGNNETKLLGFANFYCNYDGGRYRALFPDGKVKNSHGPTYGMYDRMLRAYRESQDMHRLTPEDIKRILAAQYVR